MYKGKHDIIGTEIDACDYEYVLQKIRKSIRNEMLLISPLASQTLVRAHYDRQLRDILSHFDLLVPDSQWVRHASWLLYGVKLRQRVYGPKLMQEICNLAEQQQYSVMLYGSTKKIVQQLKNELTRQYPKLQICRTILSPFRSLTAKEEQDLIETISSEKPDILFVGLGSPLQEEFTVRIAKKVPGNFPITILPVGAAFDFIAKIKPQAPQWVGDLGLEWLFRLICEPHRLWRRYLINGTLFVFLVVRQKVKKII